MSAEANYYYTIVLHGSVELVHALRHIFAVVSRLWRMSLALS